MPLTEVLKVEVKNWGLGRFLFAGMPAWVTSFLINMFRTYGLDEVMDWVWNKYFSNVKSKKTKKRLGLWRARIFNV
jgi:hypothetical protein